MWIRFALFNATLAAVLTAQPRSALNSLTVAPDHLVLAPGTSKALIPKISAVADARLRTSYGVTDTTAAMIDSTGRVTARAPGFAVLTVTTKGEAEGFTTGLLTVLVPVEVR